MIATLTRAMIALQLAILAGLTWILVRIGWLDWLPALLASASLLLAARAAIIVNNYWLSGARRQRMHDGSRPPPLRLAGRVAQEVCWSMACWFWLFPTSRPFFVQAQDYGKAPVLMLHGYGANSAFWRPWSQRLTQAGISHAAIDLEPVLASIDDYAPLISHAVNQLRRSTGSERVILLCHSMGGLAARAWLRACGGACVARVITLGSPHYGSELAAYGVGINAHQMRPASSDVRNWLQSLGVSEGAELRRLFVSIYSRHDNIVSPQASSILPGARMVALDLIGHVALGFDAEVSEMVLAEIISARQSRSTAETR